MNSKKKGLILLASAALLLCGCSNSPLDSSEIASSASIDSSFPSSSLPAAKKRYSLSVSANQEGVSVVDLEGNPLAGEYEEDTQVSFRILGAERFEVRVVFNEYTLKSVDGVYSFLMARNSSLSVIASLKSFRLSFSGEERVSPIFTDENGTPIENQNGVYSAGETAYFTIARAGETNADYFYFYEHCYEARVGETVIEPNADGVYALTDLSDNQEIVISSHEHLIENGECRYCHKKEKELAVYQTSETATVEFNPEVGGWQIGHLEGKTTGEFVISKSYLVSLFDKEGDVLSLYFGNGKSFGFTPESGNALSMGINIYTKNPETGVKGIDCVARPFTFGDDGSLDQKASYSIKRDDIVNDAVDGKLYIYVNFGDNVSSTDYKCPYLFLYDIKAPDAPKGNAVMQGDGDVYAKTSSTYEEGLGYTLKSDSGSSNPTLVRGILSSEGLRYAKSMGQSKVTFVLSDSFDGNTSMGDVYFSFFTWTHASGFTFAIADALLSSFEQGSFEADGKVIKTYSVTIDLQGTFGDGWENLTLWAAIGKESGADHCLKGDSAYIHEILFTK